MNDRKELPPGWDRDRIDRVLAHYESQADEDAAAEDEASLDETSTTTMAVPNELVPAVRELIGRLRRTA